MKCLPEIALNENQLFLCTPYKRNQMHSAGTFYGAADGIVGVWLSVSSL